MKLVSAALKDDSQDLNDAKSKVKALFPEGGTQVVELEPVRTLTMKIDEALIPDFHERLLGLGLFHARILVNEYEDVA